MLLSCPQVNPADRWSASALVCALRNSEAALELLLRDGRADPLARYGTVLFGAADLGHTTIVRLLLEHVRWSAEHVGAAIVAAAASGSPGES